MKINLFQPYSFTQQGDRDYQEDARYPDNDAPSMKQQFFIVCDGVGGSEHGEVASNTVCQAFAKKMSAYNLKKDFTNEDFKKVLDYAYDALDSKGKDVKGDMATTLTFVCFHGNGCLMAHIGDSRIYQVRKNHGIVYRSDDHSLVNNLVHKGVITPEEGVDHPQKNVITRCMEPVEDHHNRSMATVFRTTDIQPNDWFFLCSDGVLQDLTDENLVEWLTSDKDNVQKMTELADKTANNDDNNTAILIQIESVENSPVVNDDEDNERRTENIEAQATKRLVDYTEMEDVESIKKTKDKETSFIEKIKNYFQ